jgi:syntaxin-binding protein 1
MRPPPPADNNARWRTNLARGSDARAHEAVETEFVTKVLAFMVQSNLEEYKKGNPDFGVCLWIFLDVDVHVDTDLKLWHLFG